MGMLAENLALQNQSLYRYRFSLVFQFISITVTDFGLETNRICNNFAYNWVQNWLRLRSSLRARCDRGYGVICRARRMEKVRQDGVAIPSTGIGGAQSGATRQIARESMRMDSQLTNCKDLVYVWLVITICRALTICHNT